MTGLTRRHLAGFGILAAALAGGAALMTGVPVSSFAQAGAAPVNTLDSGDVAIQGYDPVAYFVSGGPRLGSAEYAVRHNGAQWYFETAENRALFEANPEKYLPAYGGYCAYGVARGYTVKIDPEAWSIHEDRLYLNYDLSVRDRWARDIEGYVTTADTNWPGLVQQSR